MELPPWASTALWASAALVLVVVWTRRNAALNRKADRQYDLRFPVVARYGIDDVRRYLRADLLAMTLVDERHQATEVTAELYDLRRFDGGHWEMREQDGSWARHIGRLRSAKYRSAIGDEELRAIEVGPAWTPVKPEVAPDLERAFQEFAREFDERGSWSIVSPVTNAVVQAHRWDAKQP
ncbi:MAG: hypothetical protein HY906_08295 [Deltaproteobacteria bacterium]|nr:hypothetical protein [Deltaproteobacteria bacterium]